VISSGDPMNTEGMDFIPVSPSKYDLTHGGWYSLSYAYAEVIKNINADIIHFTDARESHAYKGKIPAIGTLHDDYFARHRWNPFYYKDDYVDWIKRWLYYSFVTLTERKAMQKLAGLTANSNATAETVSKAYDIPHGKIKTIYLGMNLDCVPIDDQLEKERLHRPIMLLVGGNVQRKGLPVILKTMPALLKEIPELILQVIGKNQNIGRMKKLAGKLGVMDSVEFIGWIPPEKIKTYYRKASVFVMPSLMEGFGLVFLEAMAQGLPVIGGNVGGTLELIKDGKNGFLVNPGDVSTLGVKIRKFLTNLELRRRVIENSYSTVQKYPAQKMVDNTIDLYSNFSHEGG
jgi:glycosyltransferase involved in cell wall biosynthesis